MLFLAVCEASDGRGEADRAGGLDFGLGVEFWFAAFVPEEVCEESVVRTWNGRLRHVKLLGKTLTE